MSKDTGGPAFPVSDPFGAHKPQNVDEAKRLAEGMTLRDYFAAKAMKGDIASMVDPSGERCGIQIDLPDENLKRLSKLYYRMADAMLKARAE